MKAFEDSDHEGNSAAYHTGKRCVTKGCKEPAGTWWSPHWCFKHNVERIRGIDASLNDIIRANELRRMVDAETDTLRKYCDRLRAERDRAATITWRPITDADKRHGVRVLLTVGQPYTVMIGAWFRARTEDRGAHHAKPYVYPAGWYEGEYRLLDQGMAPNFVADITAAPSAPDLQKSA